MSITSSSAMSLSFLNIISSMARSLQAGKYYFNAIFVKRRLTTIMLAVRKVFISFDQISQFDIIKIRMNNLLSSAIIRFN